MFTSADSLPHTGGKGTAHPANPKGVAPRNTRRKEEKNGERGLVTKPHEGKKEH